MSGPMQGVPGAMCALCRPLGPGGEALLLELRLDEPADLIRGEALAAELADEGLDVSLCGRDSGRARRRLPRCLAALGDERTDTVAKLEQTFKIQLAINACDGVRVHHELLGERADGRQWIARCERACLDGVPDLLLELEIDRDAGAWVWLEEECHCTSILVH